MYIVLYLRWCNEVIPQCTILLSPPECGPPGRKCSECSGRTASLKNWSRLEGILQCVKALLWWHSLSRVHLKQLILTQLFGTWVHLPPYLCATCVYLWTFLMLFCLPNCNMNELKCLHVWYLRLYPVMMPLGSAGRSQSTYMVSRCLCWILKDVGADGTTDVEKENRLNRNTVAQETQLGLVKDIVGQWVF